MSSLESILQNAQSTLRALLGPRGTMARHDEPPEEPRRSVAGSPSKPDPTKVPPLKDSRFGLQGTGRTKKPPQSRGRVPGAAWSLSQTVRHFPQLVLLGPTQQARSSHQREINTGKWKETRLL